MQKLHSCRTSRLARVQYCVLYTHVRGFVCPSLRTCTLESSFDYMGPENKNTCTKNVCANTIIIKAFLGLGAGRLRNQPDPLSGPLPLSPAFS